MFQSYIQRLLNFFLFADVGKLLFLTFLHFFQRLVFFLNIIHFVKIPRWNIYERYRQKKIVTSIKKKKKSKMKH